MAKSDMFLLVEGQKSGVIKGESSDLVYSGQIDVIGWSWGMSSPAHIGGIDASSRVNLLQLQISKAVDSATPPLMACMNSNELIKKVVLTVRKAGGEQIDYFKLQIERCRITSLEVGSTSGPELNEKLSIAFEKIEVQYFPQGEDGGALASKIFDAEVYKN